MKQYKISRLQTVLFPFTSSLRLEHQYTPQGTAHVTVRTVSLQEWKQFSQSDMVAMVFEVIHPQLVTMQALHAAQGAFCGLESVKLTKSAAVQNSHVPVTSFITHSAL